MAIKTARLPITNHKLPISRTSRSPLSATPPPSHPQNPRHPIPRNIRQTAVSSVFTSIVTFLPRTDDELLESPQDRISRSPHLGQVRYSGRRFSKAAQSSTATTPCRLDPQRVAISRNSAQTSLFTLIPTPPPDATACLAFIRRMPQNFLPPSSSRSPFQVDC